MTYLKIILPAIILTGCSMGSNNYGHHGENGDYNHNQSTAYGQSCHSSACASSYSVSESNYSNGSRHYGTQPHQAPSYHSQAYQGQNHQSQGYGVPQQPSPYAYGSQVAHHGAPQGTQGAYGHAPQLRGAYGQPRRGYKYVTLGASLYDVDADIYGIQGRVGYQSANLWGAELEAFTSLTDEEETIGAATVKADVDYTFGAFGVLRSNLTPRWSIHSRAGYHFTDLSGEVTNAGVTTNVDIDGQDGFAYGIGTEYALTQRDFIRADYTRYEQDLGSNDSLSIAYGRKF